MYIVVNTTHPWLGAMTLGEYVIPGDDPHTYPDLQSAVEFQADLALEFGHSPKTAVVYELVPVPLETIQPMFDNALAAAREDLEETIKEVESWATDSASSS